MLKSLLCLDKPCIQKKTFFTAFYPSLKNDNYDNLFIQWRRVLKESKKKNCNKENLLSLKYVSFNEF